MQAQDIAGGVLSVDLKVSGNFSDKQPRETNFLNS